jgi:hypothetical protein
MSSRLSFEESTDEADDASSSSVMMSLFASYYGIDDVAENRNKSNAELIDTIHFDPDEYVRELLEKSPLETLVAKDTDMTHEIRTLDSDMQMLVYENYSKFISATETIKRMKSNMDSMENDMELLKSKMKSITITSSSLDETLYDKRSKLSKLIRLNRLLDKLQFLSELPEKLASLIDQEQYKQAVKLYNKTINILTSHSHVCPLPPFTHSPQLLTHSSRCCHLKISNKERKQ